MDQNENNPSVGGFALLFRLVAALENLVLVAGEILVYAKSGRAFDDPPWLTVDQAAERIGHHRNYVYDLIRGKKLYVPPIPGGSRIFTKHLDLQMSRGFPVLDYQSEVEAAAEMLSSRDVWFPSPVRPSGLGEVSRLKLPKRPEDPERVGRRRRRAEAGQVKSGGGS